MQQKNISPSPLHSERFEVSFNQIHDALKKIVKIKEDRFTVLLRNGAINHEVIRTYKNELEQFAKLRNAMVHEKVAVGYYIAEPKVEVVERIEKIASILTKPNYALSISSKNVIYYDVNESIVNVISGIREYGFSQYPIFSNNQGVGLLNSGDILKWMASRGVDSFANLRNVKVSEVLQAGTRNKIVFVSKKMDIFEVEEVFERAHKNNNDLGCIIITENGIDKEKPLGLITAWDLIQIDYTAD